MRLDNEGLALVRVAAVLLIGSAVLGDFHLDPADDSAWVEMDGETLEVARFDAVDLESSDAITNIATVSFTDENGNSYSPVNGGASVTFDGTDVPFGPHMEVVTHRSDNGDKHDGP